MRIQIEPLNLFCDLNILFGRLQSKAGISSALRVDRVLQFLSITFYKALNN